MPASIPILHFNDVYRVRQTDRKSGATIGADQFAARIDAIRQGWGGESPEVGTASSEPSQKGEGGDGTPDKDTRDWLGDAQRERRGLVLFSGDVWNPSVESSVTRGEHLVPVMNAIGVDCAVLGK